MDLEMIKHSLLVSLFRTFYAVFSVCVLILLLKLLDVFVIRDLDVVGELRDSNTAVAIVVGAVVLATALIIGLVSL